MSSMRKFQKVRTLSRYTLKFLLLLEVDRECRPKYQNSQSESDVFSSRCCSVFTTLNSLLFRYNYRFQSMIIHFVFKYSISYSVIYRFGCIWQSNFVCFRFRIHFHVYVRTVVPVRAASAAQPEGPVRATRRQRLDSTSVSDLNSPAAAPLARRAGGPGPGLRLAQPGTAAAPARPSLPAA